MTPALTWPVSREWRMAAWQVLFQNDSVPSMLARISGICGPFPREMLQTGRHAHKYFVQERSRGNVQPTRHAVFPHVTRRALVVAGRRL